MFTINELNCIIPENFKQSSFEALGVKKFDDLKNHEGIVGAVRAHLSEMNVIHLSSLGAKLRKILQFTFGNLHGDSNHGDN